MFVITKFDCNSTLTKNDSVEFASSKMWHKNKKDNLIVNLKKLSDIYTVRILILFMYFHILFQKNFMLKPRRSLKGASKVNSERKKLNFNYNFIQYICLMQRRPMWLVVIYFVAIWKFRSQKFLFFKGYLGHYVLNLKR